MNDDQQADMFSATSDLGFMRFLLADLHDDLPEKIARFRLLADLSLSLGAGGTMLSGGQTTYRAW
ncbi:hypothetical protein [Rhizobium leguminosarum]|uniref:hypothetical protein n=1 Tax=Rhizobium leguminosarum TaxID=384 RepID=UPI001FE05AE9|nr:hypothetical protein [Rhizobium leguminosarum]